MEENKPEEQKSMEPVESPAIGKLIMALAKAQGQIKAAPKDTTNTFFKSKYADLASVWDACREPLAKNGIAVIQRPNPTDGNTISLTTILAHESGEWMRGTLIMRPVKSDPQGLGSCLTYARRYALSAMVGICSEEDDDGNKASQEESHESEAGAADPDGEILLVSKVREIVPTTNPKYVVVHTTEDKRLGTGDEALIAIAAEVMKLGEEVRFHYVHNGRFTDLTGIERRQAAPPPAAGPAKGAGAAPAPKRDPHQMGPMSPSIGCKKAIGTIAEQLATTTSGYIGWLMDNQQDGEGNDMKFATKDAAINALMSGFLKSKQRVSMEYKPAPKKGTANIIMSVRPEAPAGEEVPF